MKKFRSRQS